jgi:transcriptional regulator with XRE-family HTH domain
VTDGRHLAENVRFYRQRAGLSPAELARRMGTGPPMISRLEAGKTTKANGPHPRILHKLAEILGVSERTLLAPPLPGRDQLLSTCLPGRPVPRQDVLLPERRGSDLAPPRPLPLALPVRTTANQKGSHQRNGLPPLA